jgi:hypothetical protein
MSDANTICAKLQTLKRQKEEAARKQQLKAAMEAERKQVEEVIARMREIRRKTIHIFSWLGRLTKI